MAGSSNALFDHGARKAITAPFRTVLFAIIAAFVLFLGRIAIDGFFIGSDPAALAAAQAALHDDIAQAASMPSPFASTQARALSWALATHEMISTRTGLARSLLTPAQALSAPEQAFQRGLHASGPFWVGIMVGTQILAVRAAILVSLLPLALLAYAVALVDGLVGRNIRRVAGGRESATIYHRAKYFHLVALTVTIAGYLWWPAALSPQGLFVLAIGFFAWLLRTQCQYYKKYT